MSRVQKQKSSMLPGYRWTKMRWIDFTLYKRFIVFALFGFLFTLPKRDFTCIDIVMQQHFHGYKKIHTFIQVEPSMVFYLNFRFMWIMGVCIPFSVKSTCKKKTPLIVSLYNVTRRSIILFLLGFFWNTVGKNVTKL